MDYSGGVWFRWHKRPDGSPSEWPQCVLGRHGEAIVCKYLEEEGYEVINQDLILVQEEDDPWSIADIVAKDPEGDAVLVKVRTTYTDDKTAHPYDGVSLNEEAQMSVDAWKYLDKNYPKVKHVRHDLVSVLVFDGDEFKVTHRMGLREAGWKENDK